MFPYDAQIAAAVQTPAGSVADVLQTMRKIDGLCAAGDGLKWFNGLYLRVTEAVEDRIARRDFADTAWLSELDVKFANLYFAALRSFQNGGACPGCWRTLFGVRNDARIARIQFALAGVNAHINHDLANAIVQTCEAASTAPSHACPQYADYTNINSTLDAQIDAAKKTLMVRLLGDALPPVNHVENAVAAWGTAAAREQAWNHSEALWQLRALPGIGEKFLDGLDGLATFAGKALLAPAPVISESGFGDLQRLAADNAR